MNIVNNRLMIPDADIYIYPDFFKEEADSLFKILFDRVEWQQDYINIYDKRIPLPRLTAWYGDPNKAYTYSGITMKPHVWSKTLLHIKSKIEKISQVEFTSVLINQYRTGKDSVSWHSDDEEELGENPIIGSVSFGSSRVFQLKHKSNNSMMHDVVLNNGSFLLMKGHTQTHWLHRIPKTTQDVGPRINLTFRVIW